MKEKYSLEEKMTDDPYAVGGIYYVNPEVPVECREETCRQLDWDVSSIQQEIKDAALPNVSKKKIVAKFNEIFSPWVTLIK